MSSPGILDDRRCAIDVAIIKQSMARTGFVLRWCPTDRMLADSLTKNKGVPTDLLRSCLRSGLYQLSEETVILQRQVEERTRRRESHRATTVFKKMHDRDEDRGMTPMPDE